MSTMSKIEWTESTWNPVRGCTKVSPGCANCYAETFAERWRGVSGHAYEQGFDLRLVPEKLDEPLRTKKPTTYFVNSMSDLFQDGVPDAFIDRVFAVMALSPQHTFQILTKRAQRMRQWFSDGCSRQTFVATVAAAIWDALPERERWRRFKVRAHSVGVWPLTNVWLGVSVENQHFADERIPLLLETPAAVRFISAEPLLGPVNLTWESTVGVGQLSYFTRRKQPHIVNWPGLDWVIVGGESGHGARPFHIKWARSIVDQCKAAGVPVFVKQLGSQPVNAILGPVNPVNLRTVGAIKDRKGGDPAEWPEDLRVREFPASCEPARTTLTARRCR